ncbi:hypothetical protein CDAR_511861 [Caerostris darwini]|uniref:Uncharacterized protein n=1 Tax=Caerostris darwini TaxID=1538125 RepID=A0AAV4P5G7_9ARAC|nr:hypothetical protein CDAR_511861 [Caerostris darwini]
MNSTPSEINGYREKGFLEHHQEEIGQEKMRRKGISGTPSRENEIKDREKGFLEHHQEEIGQEKMRVVIVERQTFSSGSSPSAGILVSQLNELDTK